jgi:hypothetical protein
VLIVAGRIQENVSELPKAEVINAVRGGRALSCRFCGHVVTHQREAIEVGGSHVHTRLNPSGVLFRFGCFRAAAGARVSGEPSSEHVWFTGCLWQYAHCAKCSAHLGWCFSGAEAFFGLVLDRLAE